MRASELMLALQREISVVGDLKIQVTSDYPYRSAGHAQGLAIGSFSHPGPRQGCILIEASPAREPIDLKPVKI